MSFLSPNERVELTRVQVSLAGRVMSIRESGAKIKFYDLHADGHKVQILAQEQ